MARLLKTQFGLRIALDGPVGKGGGNARGDVGIVQFALRVASSGNANPFGGSSGSMFKVPGRNAITVDGAYGPETADYIAAYQAMRKNQPSNSGGPMPAPTGSFAGPTGPGWQFVILHSDANRIGGAVLVDQVAGSAVAPIWLKALFLGT